VATFSFSSTVAEPKTITVVVGGVTLHDTPAIRVFLQPTTTQIAISPETSTAGQSIHVTWTVTGAGGTPTGTMSISSLDETGVGCSVPVGQGFCDFVLNTPTVHHISASYSGDGQFDESTDQELHTVSPVTPTDQAPVGFNDGYTTAGVNQPLTVGATLGVLANDTDPDPGDVLTASNASTPTAVGGSVSLSPDGSFTYTPPPDVTGMDSFTYTVSDGELTATATVTITIP
jgi:hypothetical protein